MKLRSLMMAGAAVSVLALSACGGDKGLNGEEPFNQDAADQQSSGRIGQYDAIDGLSSTDTSTQSRSEQFAAAQLNDPASPLSARTLYFEYDSTQLDAHARATAVAHAKFLAANPTMQIVLQGHTDERGTREYNIALGQRRAEVVKRLFMIYGVVPSQVRLISYGEEKPAALGHTESAWGKNRRVEIRYEG